MNDDDANRMMPVLRILNGAGDQPPKREFPLHIKIIGWTIMAPPIVLVLSAIVWGIVAIWRAVL